MNIGDFNKSEDVWDILYEQARKVQNPREVSPFVEAGSVAAAILTKAGNIYVGGCIDTACSLGMCAERNAMANMITFGENEIDRVVAVMGDGQVGPPCGACREMMIQLCGNNKNAMILLDYKKKKSVPLFMLMPDWWGEGRF